MTNGNRRNRFQSLAMIAVFDIAGPYVAYLLLRSAGQSAVSALVLSGILPAVGVISGAIRHRRVDTVGIVVLAGIAVGTVLGLLSGNARLVLIEGSVPTAVFGLVCLNSLWAQRPLIYRFALEFTGPDTPKGQEFQSLWQYQEFRHVFRLYTLVWGVVYLAEAAARIIIVETTSTSTALAVSKVMPYAVAGALVAWMVAYGRRAKREGERLAAQAAAADTTGIPATGVLATSIPATGVLATGVLATGVPATGVPATGVPATGVLATGIPGPSTPAPSAVRATTSV